MYAKLSDVFLFVRNFFARDFSLKPVRSVPIQTLTQRQRDFFSNLSIQLAFRLSFKNFCSIGS